MEKILREREREIFFVQEKYTQNGREWEIYSQRKKIRKVKIKENKREK